MNDSAFLEDKTITPLPLTLSTILISSKSFIARLIVSGETLYFPANTERPYKVLPSAILPVYILLAKSKAIY